MSWLNVFIVSTAFGAVCMDIIQERVANEWIFLFWGLGIVYQLVSKGLEGLPVFLGGAGIPILCLFILYMFRMLGPGDIKVLSALGGFMGIAPILKCMAVSFFIGAVISLAILIANGNFVQRLWYFTNYISQLIQTKQRRPYYRPGKQEENIHFTVPMLIGVILFAGGVYS